MGESIPSQRKEDRNGPLGNTLIERADHEYPGGRDHVARRRNDGDRCNIKTEQVPEGKQRRADHLGQMDATSAHNSCES